VEITANKNRTLLPEETFDGSDQDTDRGMRKKPVVDPITCESYHQIGIAAEIVHGSECSVHPERAMGPIGQGTLKSRFRQEKSSSTRSAKNRYYFK